MSLPIEIEGDWVRADQIAAIDSFESSETDCGKDERGWDLRVTLLSGKRLRWFFFKEAEMEEAKLKAVKEWVSK